MIIAGASGRIANRYKAVLQYLQRPFYSYDILFQQPHWQLEKVLQSKQLNKHTDQPVLIATPSHTHYRVLKRFYDLGFRRFLIEKPMFTEPLDYENAKDEFADAFISGIANYKYISGHQGHTIYDYYDAGQENKYWNLFQIIAMAKSTLTIKTESPIWTCTLNGRKLSLEDVHKSYILQLEEFFKNPSACLSLEEAEEWFFKVQKYIQKQLPLESKPDLEVNVSQEKSLPRSNQVVRF